MTQAGKFLMAAAIAAMAVAPATAEPVTASTVRAAADRDDVSHFAGSAGIVVALGAVAAIVVALILVGDDDADDSPTSP